MHHAWLIPFSIAALLSVPVYASPPFDACFDSAAEFHQVNETILRAIARQESGLNPRAINRNRNGTQDLGLMQINSSWLPMLARYGIRKSHLFDACTSIYVGAWILAKEINRYGNTWFAIGAYNSKTRRHNDKYVRSIYRQLMRLPPREMVMAESGPVSMNTAEVGQEQAQRERQNTQ